MRKSIKTAVAIAGVAGMLFAAPAAMASGHEDGRGHGGREDHHAHGGGKAVRAQGSCSATSDWKLKLKPDDGKTEVEFEVDQNKGGDTWHVVIRQNGTKVFHDNLVTKGASGSFEARTKVADPAGTDHYRAAAKNKSIGETCVGHASI